MPETIEVEMDSETNTLKREGIRSIINPLDEFALEQALIIKDQFNVNVDVLTMGPDQAEEVLKYCIERGAHKGFLLSDSSLAGSDTLATAKALSSFISKKKYQIVFCGQETIDSSTGQVGPSIAEQLNIPQVTFVKEIIKIEDDIFVVKKEVDFGYYIMEIKPPCLISFIISQNKLRERKDKIKECSIERIRLKDLDISDKDVGIEGSPTQVIKISVPEDRLTSFFKVSDNLSASDKIDFIINGGIKEKEKKIMLYGSSQETLSTIKKVLTQRSESCGSNNH